MVKPHRMPTTIEGPHDIIVIRISNIERRRWIHVKLLSCEVEDFLLRLLETCRLTDDNTLRVHIIIKSQLLDLLKLVLCWSIGNNTHRNIFFLEEIKGHAHLIKHSDILQLMLVNLLEMVTRFFINFTVAKLQKGLFTAPKTEILSCPLTSHYTWKTNIRIVAETNVGLIHVAHIKVRETFFHGNTIRCLLVINSIVNVKNNRSNHLSVLSYIILLSET